MISLNPTTRSAIRSPLRTITTIVDSASVTRSFEIFSVSPAYPFLPFCPTEDRRHDRHPSNIRRHGESNPSSDFPNATFLGVTLGLDLSKATVTSTEAGVVSIVDAFLAPSEEKVGVIAARAGRRTLDLVFLTPTLSVQPYIEGRLGADQHVEPSKHGPGLAIAFRSTDLAAASPLQAERELSRLSTA